MSDHFVMTNSTVMGERGSNMKVREKKYLCICSSGAREGFHPLL